MSNMFQNSPTPDVMNEEVAVDNIEPDNGETTKEEVSVYRFF
jgi:hypothetical protein